MQLLTASQMRKIEQAAIARGEATGLELMEKAGQGVVDAIFAHWPEIATVESTNVDFSQQSKVKARQALVLCGPGHNGGDGFVVARLLAVLGWQVQVFLFGNADRLPKDARVTFERWNAIGDVHAWDDPAIEAMIERGQHDLIIDALFGIGLTRAMPKQLERTRQAITTQVTTSPSLTRYQKYVAIDMPSGLCAESGADFGACPADLTVTFHAPKLGHYLLHHGQNGGGPGMCGALRVADIGLDHENDASFTTMASPHRNLTAKFSNLHKYSHGHAFVLSGGSGQTGAARLAARGALRVGAGLVTLGVPPNAQLEVACHVTAIMVRRVPDAPKLEHILLDARLNALCVGPGFGTGAAQQELIGAALDSKRPIVLDADALSVLRFDQDAALAGKLHKNCVLTPHDGEFRRMFPDLAAKMRVQLETGPAYSKVDATRDAAERAGCVVLFKGPDTVIADQDGSCIVHGAFYGRDAPWLATAGSGDVLAGFIAGLMARGIKPIQAAETAAWLHVECARSFGPGLIAEDLPEQVPAVLRGLQNAWAG
ncbi:MAG: NAD(P)H-hydrate dehydratase [Aliishimia sp.]